MRKFYLFAIIFFLPGLSVMAQTWASLGPKDISQPSYSRADFTAIATAPDGAIYVAYKDFNNGNKATVEKYTSGAWSLVGTAGFSAAAIEYIKIAIAPDGTPYVVLQIKDGMDLFRLNATVMKFSGSNWSVVGTLNAQQFDFNSGPDYYPNIDIAIAPDNSPFVAYSDYSQAGPMPQILSGTVKKFDGTNWVIVGSAGFTGSSQAKALSFSISQSDGTPYFLFEDDMVSNAATVMKFDGSSWVLVGARGFSNSSEIAYPSIAITSDGIPYVAYKDVTHSNKATVMVFNGSSWTTVGSIGFSAGVVEYISLAIDQDFNPYVAYKDVANGNKATVKKFNGTNWINAGTADFSYGVAQYTAMAIGADNKPYIVYRDAVNNLKATVQKLDPDWAIVGAEGLSGAPASATSAAIGTNGNLYVAYKNGLNNKASVREYIAGAWTDVGNTNFSPGSIDYLSLAINPSDGTPYVAFKDAANAGKATAYFLASDNAWTLMGTPGFSTGNISYTSLAVSQTGTPYIAYADVANTDKASVKTYNGSTWASVGVDGFSTGSAFYISIAISPAGVPYVAYQNNTNGKATVMQYNGSSWVSVGPAIGFSTGTATYTSIAFASDGTLYVAYEDASNNKTTVKKFLGGAWVSVGSSTGISTGIASNINIKIATDGAPYVSYQDAANNNKFTVQKFSSGSWAVVGTGANSEGSAGTLSLALSNTGTPYVAYSDGYAWAKYFTTGGNPVPVTLTYFTAVKQNNETKLSWQTASEANSSYFIVEHSVNGTDFSAIGKVNAAGNSSYIINYSFLHTSPVKGNNYYRLKQVDLDGKINIYPVRLVHFGSSDIMDITLFPNPASDKITLRSSQPGIRDISLINLAGQIIKRQQPGDNQQQFDIDISGLPKGTYVVLVNAGDGTKALRFVKN